MDEHAIINLFLPNEYIFPRIYNYISSLLDTICIIDNMFDK